jgi:heme-degrading monooxygenase HmoA
MYIHSTVIRVKPEKVKEALQFFSSEKNKAFFMTRKGFFHFYVMEMMEEAGKLNLESFWESRADAQVVFADPKYAAIIADLRSILIASPECIGNNLLAEFHRA